MTDHWDFFNIENIMQEAKARLAEHRLHNPRSLTIKDSMEYWVAWAAHANAAAALAARQDGAEHRDALISALKKIEFYSTDPYTRNVARIALAWPNGGFESGVSQRDGDRA